MGKRFDPYYKWLSIPPADQPPDCYSLLGLRRFEDDGDVIANAADQRMGHVRSFQSGKHSAISQKILNEISQARICLLNAEKRRNYDQQLRAAISRPPVSVPPPPPVAEAGIVLPKITVSKEPAGARRASSPASKPNRSTPKWKLLAGIGGAATMLLLLVGMLVSSTDFSGGSGSESTPDADHVSPPKARLGRLAVLVPQKERPEVEIEIVDGAGRTVDLQRLTADEYPTHTMYAMPPGTYTVRLRRKGFEDIEKSVTVSAANEVRATARWQALEREPGPDPLPIDDAHSRVIAVCKGHHKHVRSVAFSADGTRMLSASHDHTLRLWDLRSALETHRLEGHSASATDVAFLPDKMRAISSSDDNSLILWDLNSGQAVRHFRGHSGDVISLAVSPDGQRVVSSGHDRAARIWDVGKASQVRQLSRHATVESNAGKQLDHGLLLAGCEARAFLQLPGSPTRRLGPLLRRAAMALRYRRHPSSRCNVQFRLGAVYQTPNAYRRRSGKGSAGRLVQRTPATARVVGCLFWQGTLAAGSGEPCRPADNRPG